MNPSAKANPRAIDAILNADIVVVGPGDLYTSVLPNFLVDGMREALASTKAKRIYACNIMTKHGETNNFSASDFAREILRYVGREGIDYLLVNKERPSEEKMTAYESEKAQFVEPDDELAGLGVEVVYGEFLRESGDLLRHAPEKLAKAILEI